ncbi:MAG: hypothetical protein COA32_13620 [Fluviicola sp.]|nr:MAG: hypothetical protein COA32_13620 [Fluviicola sp.]
MKRIWVHTVNVSKSGEKIQFQIRLPRTVKKITGVKATANPQIRLIKKIAPDYPKEAGWLWLRSTGIEDVFFADDVKRPLPLHNQTIINHAPLDDFDKGSFWTQGKMEEFLPLDLKLDSNIIQGFYINQIVQQKVGINDHYNPIERAMIQPRGDQPVYQLKIYLKLEV